MGGRLAPICSAFVSSCLSLSLAQYTTVGGMNGGMTTFLTILRLVALQLDISKDCASEVCSI